MSDLDALLAGIVADPDNAVRWLVMADWLEENGESERAELVRVHRELLRTCTDPDAHPERPQLHARMMELMRSGVQPCLPQKTLTLPGGVELRMSYIPPGSFLMGSPKSEEVREDNETVHLVALTRGFWMGRTPVTQSQWKAVTGNNPSHFNGDELPVEMVSWDDATTFCAATTEQVRLPTEVEWEYAARSGTTTPFYWGEEWNGTLASCYGNTLYDTETPGPYLHSTTPVGRYVEVSPHPWGLADVLGNVWEWCDDWYDAYSRGDTTAPIGPENASERVFRGGSWYSHVLHCRSAYRGRGTPDKRNPIVGFRIAADGDAFG